MKKILSYMSIAITGLLMAACSDDYKDWQAQQTYPQEEPITIPGFSASSTPVDLNTSEDFVRIIALNGTLPEGTTIEHIRFVPIVLGTEEAEIKAADDVDLFAKSDLQKLVTDIYGMRPVARDIEAHVYADMMIDGQGAYVDAGKCTLTITPEVPFIDEAYYVIGTVNGWDINNTDYELSNGGEDPYDNPIFTILIPAEKVTEDINFKVAPKSFIGDWSECLTASDQEGKFALHNAGGNLVIPMEENVKYYLISFDMMNQTWTGKGVNFGEYFYQIGNDTGWQTSNALHGSPSTGKYQGYYLLDGEFKFKPNADNWDNDLEYVSGTTTSGTLTDAGGPNCPDPGAGFYQIDLDVAAMTYKVTEVETISIIGTVKGNWDTDVDMTYNKETGAWEVTADLEAGEMKFRMNHDWSVSWGGNGSSKAYTDLTQNNGANLELAESGKYKVQLFIQYEGKNKVVITKQ